MSQFIADVFRSAAVLEEHQTPHVLVTLVGIRGSSPQDLSAKMLVDVGGRVCGTVGGGKIEAAAIRRAAELLDGKADATLIENWDLKRDIGMTCGGTISMLFEARAVTPWTIAIFGAGHVAQSLVRVLLPLSARLEVRDARPEWIAKLPAAPNLKASIESPLEQAIATLPSHAFVLCVTQGHQTDLPILIAALRAGTFPFIGAIGSKSKAATLRRDIVAAGISKERAATVHCPIGLEIGTNHPQEIAISIAAQILLERGKPHL